MNSTDAVTTGVWIWQIDEDDINHVHGVYASFEACMAAIDAYVTEKIAGQQMAPIDNPLDRLAWYEANYTDRAMRWDSWPVAGAHASILRNAYSLLGDGNGEEWDDNPEYARAIVELVSDTLGYSEEDRPAVLAALRAVGQEAWPWK